MNRRGYIISAAVLLIDLLCFYFGGAFVALAALIYAAGIGEYIARVKCRAIQCDPALGVKYEKLFNCYQRVKGKIEEEGHRVPSNIKVCLIPGEEMNAYCFGSRSIGVTEGALNLDNKTVEAIIAHEMGHLFNGDSILNMILVANCLGIIAILLPIYKVSEICMKAHTQLSEPDFQYVLDTLWKCVAITQERYR